MNFSYTRYVISDYTSESILKLKTHQWYSEFVQQGVVDFSIVDCENVPTVILSKLNLIIDKIRTFKSRIKLIYFKESSLCHS